MTFPLGWTSAKAWKCSTLGIRLIKLFLKHTKTAIIMLSPVVQHIKVKLFQIALSFFYCKRSQKLLVWLIVYWISSLCLYYIICTLFCNCYCCNWAINCLYFWLSLLMALSVSRYWCSSAANWPKHRPKSWCFSVSISICFSICRKEI